MLIASTWHSLLRPSHPLLPLLAAHFPFESAIGANGIVWIRTTSPLQFIAAKLVLEAADDAAQSSADDTGIVNLSLLQSPEKSPGEWGRKLAGGWGSPPSALSEAQVRNIVANIVGLDA